MLYEEFETCYVFTADQGSEEWKKQRKGIITASNIAKVTGDASYCNDSKQELALKLTGLVEEKFDHLAVERMGKGTFYEPFVRDLLSKKINKPIIERGLAVWKENPIFGASVDGLIIEDDGSIKRGVEIKCPETMYRPIKNSAVMGYKFNERRDIYDSHFFQMLLNSVVLNLDKMVYVVYAHSSGDLFTHEIDMREYKKTLFQDYIRPKVEVFYDKYMLPLILEHKIKTVKDIFEDI